MYSERLFPKITVVSPSYNQGQFLERTIRSILDQNYPNLEYIICDGGSTDNSVEIIKKYENQLSWWCSEKDKGQTDAINKGMRRATGNIVCWINSDDVLLPGALHYVGSYFAKHPDVQFVMGCSVEIDKDDRILKLTHSILINSLAKHGAYNVNQQGMFWRRSLFEKVGYLDESFHACMDAEFIIRLLSGGIECRTINKPLGAIRIYETTKTAMGGDIWTRDWEAIRQKYGGYVRSKRSVHFFLYALLKMFKGFYLSDLFFKLRNRNKAYYEL